MLLSPRKNGLTSLFREVRVFKVGSVFDRTDSSRMFSRLDNLEAKDTEVQGRLDKLDSAVETLGTSMSSQFSHLRILLPCSTVKALLLKRRSTEQSSH